MPTQSAVGLVPHPAEIAASATVDPRSIFDAEMMCSKEATFRRKHRAWPRAVGNRVSQPRFLLRFFPASGSCGASSPGHWVQR